MVNLYTSTLTSFLTAVKLEPIPNSLEELVSFFEQGKIREDCLITMQRGNQILLKLNVKKHHIYFLKRRSVILLIDISREECELPSIQKDRRLVNSKSQILDELP